jgi:hypothetical protein
MTLHDYPIQNRRLPFCHAQQLDRDTVVASQLPATEAAAERENEQT